jgi:hypothetical protein
MHNTFKGIKFYQCFPSGKRSGYSHAHVSLSTFEPNDQKGDGMLCTALYRMSHEEMSIFWEVIVLVILSKKVSMYMCLILNGFRATAISLYSSKTVDKRYYVLFLIPVFIVQVTKLVQFT